ncbi:lysozyme inhibitor [Vibrio sp. S9_S30]|uniref:MliC family protein n=1 Tax=Vibrio sp. S9_S30 TaxID=2720226 RepID=UPI0016801E3A|nr:MliC family protein [Vibrio sp. S9_S30]MBD1555818.1 lysozyme inhibitor [Vibrio sp. S9_S30]
MLKTFITVGALLVMAGCSSSRPGTSAYSGTNAYSCGDDLEIWTYPINEYELQLEINNERYLMERVSSASGERFENRRMRYVFWVKGTQASLFLPNVPMRMCHQITPNKTSLSPKNTLF